MAAPDQGLVTDRLVIRPPVEADRARFVELFRDEGFMVFSGGALAAVDAQARFDRMLALVAEVPFAKQPIVERSSGRVVGYTGVDRIEFEDGRWLEWGYRLVPGVRGRGYATEASSALLATVDSAFRGEILGLIHPGNEASRRVIEKLHFQHWKRGPVQGEVRDLFRWDG